MLWPHTPGTPHHQFTPAPLPAHPATLLLLPHHLLTHGLGLHTHWVQGPTAHTPLATTHTLHTTHRQGDTQITWVIVARERSVLYGQAGQVGGRGSTHRTDTFTRTPRHHTHARTAHTPHTPGLPHVTRTTTTTTSRTRFVPGAERLDPFTHHHCASPYHTTASCLAPLPSHWRITTWVPQLYAPTPS